MSGIVGTSFSKSGIIGKSQDTAKAWCNISNGGTVNDSFNASSATDMTAGIYKPNFDNDMANTNYSVVTSVDDDGSTRHVTYYDQLVGSVIIKCVNHSEVSTDPDSISVVIFGD